MSTATMEAIPMALPHAEFEAVRTGAKQFVLHKGEGDPRAGGSFELADAETDERIAVDITYVTSAGNPCALSPDGLTPGFSICSIALR